MIRTPGGSSPTMRDTDYRDLVRAAMPDSAPGLIAALGRLGAVVGPPGLYTRLNAVLKSPAAAALPAEGRITLSHLRTAERIVAFVRSHHVNPDHLRKDDFDAFFAERSAALLKIIEGATGIKLGPSEPEPDPIGEEEDEADLPNVELEEAATA